MICSPQPDVTAAVRPSIHPPQPFTHTLDLIILLYTHNLDETTVRENQPNQLKAEGCAEEGPSHGYSVFTCLFKSVPNLMGEVA